MNYEQNNLKITALPQDKLVKLLQQAGSRAMTLEKLQEDIGAGAPVNPDGTLNLITYSAWLAKETSEDGD